MPVTTGSAFYETDALNTSTIDYGFDLLDEAHLVVVGIDSNNNRTPLVKDVNYSLNAAAQRITAGDSGGVETTWAGILSASTVKVRVFRSSSLTALVDFTDGAVLSESDLDASYKQCLQAAQELAENASGETSPQTVVTANIDDGAVTSTKIAAGAVNSAKIDALGIQTSNLDNGIVTQDKLAASSVGSTQLINNAVTYAKVDSATKAEMEGEDTEGIVTPDVVKYGPMSPRAYGAITYTSATGILSGSFNVDSGAGAVAMRPAANQRKVFFDTNVTGNYVVMATLGSTEAASAHDDGTVVIVDQSADSFTLQVGDESEATGRYINFVVFGGTLSS